MQVDDVIIYRRANGEEPVIDWINSFRDKTIARRMRNHIQRMKLGLFGDYKGVGDGIFELRMHFGSGYRLYFAFDENRLVILLCGGDKSTQVKDIKKAKEFYIDYIRAHYET